MSTEQSRLVAARRRRILLNFFHPWTAAECGQRAESQDACRLSEVTRRV